MKNLMVDLKDPSLKLRMTLDKLRMTLDKLRMAP